MRVAIVGGGILGLMVLRELKQCDGVDDVLLFERSDLGCKQTLHSQAYLHSGHVECFIHRGNKVRVSDFPAPFAIAKTIWGQLIKSLGVKTNSESLILVEDAAISAGEWKSTELEELVKAKPIPFAKRKPKSQLRISESETLSVLQSPERCILNTSDFIEKFKDRFKLNRHIVKGNVTKAENNGRLVVQWKGRRKTLEFDAVVVASGAQSLSKKSAKRSNDTRIIALVFIGETVPEFALTRAVKFESKRSVILCVPREAAGGERGWICSFGIKVKDPCEKKAATLARLQQEIVQLSGSLQKLCPGLTGTYRTAYIEDFWPYFGPNGYQLVDSDRLITCWPSRLTLAPLAAKAVSDKVRNILPKRIRRRAPIPFSGTVDTAEELWTRYIPSPSR